VTAVAPNSSSQAMCLRDKINHHRYHTANATLQRHKMIKPVAVIHNPTSLTITSAILI
jgi:hypothetical protein